MDTSKLSEQANSRVYVKIAKTFPSSPAYFEKGMIGPITSRSTRYIFAVTQKGSFEVGQVNVKSGTLLDTQNYGPDNTRDAQIVINAVLNG